MRLVALLLAELVLLAGSALAQTPAPHAGDIVVPLQERNTSGVHGTVTLHPQGSKTMINVNMFSGPVRLRPTLELRPGADCNGATMASTHPIVLNPINTGQVSRTFVSVPIESFRKSNFIVDVRDSTTREQALQACARISH